MSSTLPPEFDLSRLSGIPDPADAEHAPVLDSPPAPPGVPVRSQRVARQRVALALGIGWFLVQLAVLGTRDDLAKVPFSYLAALVIAPLAGAGLALVLAMAPGKLGLGARPAWLTAAAIALPAGLFLAGLVLSPAHDSAREGTFAQGLKCCVLMAAWAALPMAAAAVVLRRWFVVSAGVKSALVGVAAAMAAAAVLNLHCQVTGVWHVAVGHWFAVVVAAVAGLSALARRTRV